MTEQEQGLSRRRLLRGVGAGAAITVAAGAAALPRSQVATWDFTTDVLVAGSGAAGIAAALEAGRQGARVLVIESLPQFGGSSALSGGVIYAGGGTALQRTLGIEDSVEDMYQFLLEGAGPYAQPDKIQMYCEDSVAHFDWLLEQGIPYSEKFTPDKGLPMGDESLYFSGNEQAWPARDVARPAARGHVPGVPGMNGGRRLMQALLARARAENITLLARVAAQQLVTEHDGRIVGAVLDVDGERKVIRVLRGTVLACGGFIHNREMLQHYAPELAACSVPWGNAGDLGGGINMGVAAGAAALRMHHGFAIAPLYPPDTVLAGIVVNAAGQRFIAEDSYHGVLGDAIAYHQRGKAWLITDASSGFSYPQDNFPLVATSTTLGDLAAAVGFPQGALQHTLSYYNRFASTGRDPLFQKHGHYLRPLQGPPYKAWDLSVARAFFPAHTFGGLQTDLDGRVINSFGVPIEGLYAAGRTAAGLPTAPYIASGLSVGDCTFFGRRAGVAAAGGRG